MRIVFTLLLVLWPTLAAAQLACGIRDIRPIGCQGPPVCVCNADGDCQWIWTNCR